MLGGGRCIATLFDDNRFVMKLTNFRQRLNQNLRFIVRGNVSVEVVFMTGDKQIFTKYAAIRCIY